MYCTYRLNELNRRFISGAYCGRTRSAQSMAAVSLSLKVTAPALFEKRDRILADGPVILAGAMRHYLVGSDA